MEVGVLDPVPLFRHGVLCALGGGHALRTPVELLAWLATVDSALVVFSIFNEDPDTTDIVRTVAHQRRLRPVALLAEYSDAAAARLVRSGILRVAARDLSTEQLRVIVGDAQLDVVQIAEPVLRAALAAPAATDRPTPSDEQLRWLRALASGVTVTALALQQSVSERVMYRRLDALYRQLGVGSRTEALLLSREEGWT